MQCPRLKHFVRFNSNGTLGRCGHMVDAPQFSTLDSLDSSEWLTATRNLLENETWPSECKRCKNTEDINGTSIRLNSIEFHKSQLRPDYLVVGGILDNLCNSACQTCGPNNSTKIGSLSGNIIRINNSNKFWDLPQERIVHLDINGGEPSYSPYYKEILNNLPSNVKSVRLNTNCTTVLEELSILVANGIEVTVTVSFDGVESVHDYLRWPIKWDKFLKNLMIYKTMSVKLNLWTTVSALNIANFTSILNFAKEHKFDHSWALLEKPNVLSVEHSNFLTRDIDIPEELKYLVASGKNNEAELTAYINEQDTLRNINIKDFIK